jgi:hypothetical protein
MVAKKFKVKDKEGLTKSVGKRYIEVRFKKGIFVVDQNTVTLIN